MRTATHERSAVVVGAGLAGLLAARTMAARGLRVTVLEKGPAVGGRMATRRFGAGLFDHGAQFFTVRDPLFGRLVADWWHAGVVQEWCRGFSTGFSPAREDGHPRFRGTGGMASILKHLARGLDVHVNERVVDIAVLDGRWRVKTDAGTDLIAGAVLLTPPVPQALALLDAGGVTLPGARREALEAVRYAPCLTVLALVDGASGIPEPGAVQLDSEPLTWIADNRRKGISPEAGAVTLQASPAFSQTYWDAPDEKISAALLSAARPWLCTPVVATQVHRWRNAKAVTVHPERCLVVEAPAPLIFAGDGFGAPRVEGAALSGLAAADALTTMLLCAQERLTPAAKLGEGHRCPDHSKEQRAWLNQPPRYN